DVYAAGCVLYELITGDPPFTGDSPVAVAYQHVREDPTPPSHQNPGVSPTMDAVVLKAMSKNPANRYQSAAEMRTDLVRALSGQRPMAPMVMTDADRTSMLDAGPTHMLPPTRHRPEPGGRHADDERRSRPGVWILAATVAVAVIVMMLLLFTNLLGGGPTPVPVPNVVGQPVLPAQQSLNAAGFETKINRVPSAPEDLDRVVRMDPSGEALPGATIRLDVGTGPAEVEVPNLFGLDVGQAQASLQRVGLVLAPEQRQRVVQDQADIGRVVEQTPAAGAKLAKNGAVTITVGVPPATIPVPNVVGSNVGQAQSTITGAGLVAQVQEVDSAEPQGQVLQQDPAGGSQVEAGSTVTITVSRGNQLEMPDLTGQAPDQAQRTLQGLGWTGSFNVVAKGVEDEDEEGRIIAQDVAPGSSFTRDQTITITVGTKSRETSTSDSGGGIFDPPGNGGG
ncbi:MAG TPA: PASTA domain-containing protein, partial [Pseudonocardiaceae bacterium]|nr:PASTA domain-containing protein [Pseudonocardiaceae bacterium]